MAGLLTASGQHLTRMPALPQRHSSPCRPIAKGGVRGLMSWRSSGASTARCDRGRSSRIDLRSQWQGYGDHTKQLRAKRQIARSVSVDSETEAASEAAEVEDDRAPQGDRWTSRQTKATKSYIYRFGVALPATLLCSYLVYGEVCNPQNFTLIHVASVPKLFPSTACYAEIGGLLGRELESRAFS